MREPTGYRTLLAAGEKAAAGLSELLDPRVHDPLVVCGSGGEARRRFADAPYDLVLINTPCPDEYGLELAADLAESSPTGVLVLVRSEDYDEAGARLAHSGVMLLGKPFTRGAFRQALSLVETLADRLRRCEEEKNALRAKLEEQRAVGRAKCLLMQNMHLDEDAAHRYLEKQAMDTRMTRRALAEQIIRLLGS